MPRRMTRSPAGSRMTHFVHFRLDEHLYQRLDAIGEADNQFTTEIIRRACKDYCDREEFRRREEASRELEQAA